MKKIEKTEEVYKTVLVQHAKSVTDQILDLPINSVVLVRGAVKTVLHRTGKSGWLVTRALSGYGPGERYYYSEDIRGFISEQERQGAEFYADVDGLR